MLRLPCRTAMMIALLGVAAGQAAAQPPGPYQRMPAGAPGPTPTPVAPLPPGPAAPGPPPAAPEYEAAPAAAVPSPQGQWPGGRAVPKDRRWRLFHRRSGCGCEPGRRQARP
jgi:hypothetical protein